MNLAGMLALFASEEADAVLRSALLRELLWGGGRPRSDVFIIHHQLLYRGPDVRTPRLGWSAAFGWRDCVGPRSRRESWGTQIGLRAALRIMIDEIDYGRYAF